MKDSGKRTLRIGILVALTSIVLNSRYAVAQGGQGGGQGPPPFGVEVVNVPLPVTGTVTAKSAQTAISQVNKPTCDSINRCFVTFPAVPVGKRLRVTRIFG